MQPRVISHKQKHNPELVEGLNLLNPVGVHMFYGNVSILLLDPIRDPEEQLCHLKYFSNLRSFPEDSGFRDDI